MDHYRDIDELLLTVNKGPGFGLGGKSAKGVRPGDGVIVSVGRVGFGDILVHGLADSGNWCRGQVRSAVHDNTGKQVLDRDEYVQFSFNKIAGIHRA